MTSSDILNAEVHVSALMESGIDITESYEDWIRVGLSLASLGEDGRKLFHEVSSLHSSYEYEEADAKFSNLLKSRNGNVSLGTFINYCRGAGVKVFINGSKGGKKKTSGKAATISSKDTMPDETSGDDDEQWLYNVEDVLNAPDQETLWSFITKGVNNAIVASSEAGKSTLVLLLAIAIAKEQEEFLKWPLTTPKGRSIYVSTEDGISQIKHRMSIMLRGVKIPKESILFILEAYDLPKRLDTVLSETPADLVFIDTWGDLVSGKYDGELTRKTMGAIKRVCVKHDCTPVYVHHTNKASENIPDKSSIKGAGDFEQACRVVMMLSIYDRHRWLCCVKGNPFPEDTKNECHQLCFDGETQSMERTGITEPRLDMVEKIKLAAYGKREIKTDWVSVLDGKHMKRKELVELLNKEFKLKKSQAYERIKKGEERSALKIDDQGLFYA